MGLGQRDTTYFDSESELKNALKTQNQLAYYRVGNQ